MAERPVAAQRFLDEFHAGDRFLTEGITVTDGEIIRFAMQYDPQSFHLDVEAAKRSPYGGLIATPFFFPFFKKKGPRSDVDVVAGVLTVERRAVPQDRGNVP